MALLIIKEIKAHLPNYKVILECPTQSRCSLFHYLFINAKFLLSFQVHILIIYKIIMFFCRSKKRRHRDVVEDEEEMEKVAHYC